MLIWVDEEGRSGESTGVEWSMGAKGSTGVEPVGFMADGERETCQKENKTKGGKKEKEKRSTEDEKYHFRILMNVMYKTPL